MEEMDIQTHTKAAFEPPKKTPLTLPLCDEVQFKNVH